MFEFVDVFKVAVDGGEADVGYGVDFFETAHDEFADGGGGAFAFGGVDDEGFDGVDDDLDLGDGDVALLGGVQETLEDFLAVEALAAAVFLYDHVGDLIEALVGGEALGAAFTFAAAANGIGVLAFAGVDDFVLGEAAVRAFHAWIDSSKGVGRS